MTQDPLEGMPQSTTVQDSLAAQEPLEGTPQPTTVQAAAEHLPVVQERHLEGLPGGSGAELGGLTSAFMARAANHFAWECMEGA